LNGRSDFERDIETNQDFAVAQIAQRVAELEFARFDKGQGTLLEVNLRELAAAGAQSKVIDTLADVQRAQEDLRAAMGADARIDDSKR